MTGLPDAQRETALHIVREHNLSDNDPLIALLALMRLRDSAFVVALDAAMQAQQAALDSHSSQLSREMSEFRKELTQTREAPRLVAESVARLHTETAGIEAAAAELANHSRARIQEFVFGRMAMAAICGGGLVAVIFKYFMPWLAHLFSGE